MRGQNIEYNLNLLKDHYLEPVTEGGPVEAYYIREDTKDGKKTRMMSTLITFSPEGITITGDLTPGQNGVIIPGYNKDWFASQLSPGYLASKCLDNSTWESERAAADLKDWINTQAQDAFRHRDRDILNDAKKVRDSLRGWHTWSWQSYIYHFDSQDDLFNCLEDVFDYEALCGIGVGYDSAAYRWLAAIQQTFARLYQLALTAA